MIQAPLALFSLLVLAAEPSIGDDPETFFELKIRPILAGQCLKCHGGEKTSGGLRVATRDELLQGGESGPAIVPRDAATSLLLQVLRHEPDALSMPPDGKLSDRVIADFAAWIDAGAFWPPRTSLDAGGARHWAFQPIRNVSPPANDDGWSDHPIDRFVRARLGAEGLVPVAPAEPAVLARRVYFDLVGLPPTPNELAEFLDDAAPNAWSNLVERLLQSPRYGERWGRHWMDVARYSDTAGDNADYPIPEIHLYRDYVIDAFNRDKPFDQFVREQRAGDLLAPSGPPERHAEQVIATGFLALSRRFGTMPRELWHLTVEDAIDTTGRAFLGLTFRCARCHDHKFDPTTQRDYYALYGIFESTRFPYAGSEELQTKNFPRMNFAPLLPAAEAAPLIAAFESDKAKVSAALAAAEAAKKANPMDDAAKAEFDSLRRQWRERIRPGLPASVPGAYAVAEGTVVDVQVQQKGDPAQPGPVVPRGVPAFLAGSSPSTMPQGQSGRLELARWLTSPEHPLTARVMVNRIWQHHFGKGIVRTPSNFGLRGEMPTHPELLDWLAHRFVESGWSMKAMHRLILSSKTYRLACIQDPAASAQDPDNRLLWRHERKRLDAESIRDAMLAVAGNLEANPPGPHPFPPIADWNWSQHNPHKTLYPSRHRSVFLMTPRIQRHPFLALFDAPDANQSIEARTESTVPTQALFLLNNPFVTEQAAGLAQRMLSASSDPGERVRVGYQWAWSRTPQAVTKEEIEQAVAYVSAHATSARRLGIASESAEADGYLSLARVLFSASEFFYTD